MERRSFVQRMGTVAASVFLFPSNLVFAELPFEASPPFRTLPRAMQEAYLSFQQEISEQFRKNQHPALTRTFFQIRRHEWFPGKTKQMILENATGITITICSRGDDAWVHVA